MYRLKQKEHAGVQIKDFKDLDRFLDPMTLPCEQDLRYIKDNPQSDEAKEFFRKKSYYIPQPAQSYGVQGACFTGPRQINWLGELLQLGPRQAVLHMDGKYKLHHGEWVLLTLGSHCLRQLGEDEVTGLTTTFLPLVYLFCKNHESTGELHN